MFKCTCISPNFSSTVLAHQHHYVFVNKALYVHLQVFSWFICSTYIIVICFNKIKNIFSILRLFAGSIMKSISRVANNELSGEFTHTPVHQDLAVI